MNPRSPHDMVRSACYECIMLGKRDKELEPIILTDPLYSFMYARDVIKGRWEEAEEVILNDHCCTYFYAKEVIKGKLPEHMHNQMLLMAISENKNLPNYALLYIDDL